MGADVSRIRKNALLDYAGVELKQGGVVLDADFNELVAVVDRRLRATASDILGRGTVSSTTPDAFKITVVVEGGLPKLSIGKGRLYVDGLLAENHGAPTAPVFDPLMAEPTFADPVGYAEQPHPPNLPALPTTGTHLVYLDVWQREVTHLERPELVEAAVGVETSSRLQTAWQVRVLDVADGATCASADNDLAGWSALIAPSSGRLTTDTFDVQTSSDPCELPPTGGYRGLENQTYRVEIQKPGLPDGTATFKWSRENACVGSRVVSIVSSTELELQTLGRDDVLRFNTGDWVEIIDDTREFSQGCGEMRRVTVNEATRRITFAPELPGDMLPDPQTFPDSLFPGTRNLRVRRWDQKGKVRRTDPDGTTPEFQDLDVVDSPGAIKVPASGTTLLLENGTTVRFTTPGTTGLGFRAGDYWVFAARTADASVELLDQAPPRGIHHHYERLAIWDAETDTVTDCRHPWPPRGEGHDGSCTQCVTPQSHDSRELTIQMAIDRVIAAGGGTVCLAVGTYALQEPVEIEVENELSSVKLVGKGIASQLLAIGSGAVLINKSRNIVLDSFSVQCGGTQEAVGVVGPSSNIRVEHLAIDSEDPQSAAIGLAGLLTDLSLRDNALKAPTGIRGGSGGDRIRLEDVRIEDNNFDCGTAAIAFEPVTEYQHVNRICGNRVKGCNDTGFRLTGMAEIGSGLEVQANVFSVLGDGIVASLSGLRVLDNDILQAEGAPLKRQRGIVLVPGPSASKAIANCQILGNRIQGFDLAGIFVSAPLHAAMIKQNQIAEVEVGLGLVLESDGVLDQLSIENNQFNDISTSAILGKGVSASYAVTGNQIRTRSQVSAVHLEFNGGDGVFSHNECYRTVVGGGPEEPDVRLRSNTLIVGNNRVVGGGTSLNIGAAPKHYSVLGNICGGKILVEGISLAAPWVLLNLEGVG